LQSPTTATVENGTMR